MLKRLFRDRKGISLTEVIVAMTLVVIVTGAAITVVISSAQADVAYRFKYRALTACENAVDCLRYSQGDEKELQNALSVLGFQGYQDNETLAETIETEEEKRKSYDGYILKYIDNLNKREHKIVVTTDATRTFYVVKYIVKYENQSTDKITYTYYSNNVKKIK